MKRAAPEDRPWIRKEEGSPTSAAASGLLSDPKTYSWRIAAIGSTAVTRLAGT
jgi:hypothetical protein